MCTIHQNQFKPELDRQWAYLVYAGLWWEPLRGDLDAYMERVNERVTRDDRRQALQGPRARRHALLAKRRLRREPRVLLGVRRALLAVRRARLHRAVVAAVADGLAPAQLLIAIARGSDRASPRRPRAARVSVRPSSSLPVNVMAEGSETNGESNPPAGSPPGQGPPRRGEGGDLFAERRARRAAESGELALTRRAEAAEATCRRSNATSRACSSACARPRTSSCAWTSCSRPSAPPR